MTQTLITLAIAAATFVGGHFVLSSLSVRGVLIAKIGEGGHRILYSLVALGSFIWMLFAYGDASLDAPILWAGTPGLAMVPVFVMPIVCVLFVCAVTTRNPTAIGGERVAQDPKPLGGIMTVTRHPMMVAFALFAAAHMVVNGDAASLILFGALLVLTVGGMLHIDHRRGATLGSDWGPIALTTGIVPFMAAVQGRTKIDWGGIGLARVAGGLALYAALVFGHPWIAGVPIVG
jgi:uncharacterized membrane protein